MTLLCRTQKYILKNVSTTFAHFSKYLVCSTEEIHNGLEQHESINARTAILGELVL